MMIDAALLRALDVAQAETDVYAPLLAEACPQWGIDEPREMAAFLANCIHESGAFSRLTENLNYSAEGLANTWDRFSVTGRKGGAPNRIALSLHRKPQQIANTVYANRLGNGDALSGDGWRYRGRGLIQLTGLANYRAFANATDFDVVSEPDYLLQPDCAVVSACWFWQTHGCNELAQAERWEDLRARINGGLNGLKEVATLLDTALNYLGVN